MYPVPDGDTGTNMSMTISSAARELAVMDRPGAIGEVASVASSALLREERGETPASFCRCFSGAFPKDCAERRRPTAGTWLLRWIRGSKRHIKAVMKPTEGNHSDGGPAGCGTGCQAAEENNDPVYVWQEICSAAEDALAQTPKCFRC